MLEIYDDFQYVVRQVIEVFETHYWKTWVKLRCWCNDSKKKLQHKLRGLLVNNQTPWPYELPVEFPKIPNIN